MPGEAARQLGTAAVLLLNAYVELHGRQLGAVVRRSVAAMAWSSAPPPSAPRPVCDLLLERLRRADGEVTALVEDLGGRGGEDLSVYCTLRLGCCFLGVYSLLLRRWFFAACFWFSVIAPCDDVPLPLLQTQLRPAAVTRSAARPWMVAAAPWDATSSRALLDHFAVKLQYR